MIWDPCLARAVAEELSARLQGVRARALCLLREEMGAVVWLRDGTLEVDLSPGRGLIVLGPPGEPAEEAEPLPAVVAGVEAVPDERVIAVRFRRVRGKKPHPTLILELATNRWNAILAEGPERRVRKRLRAIRSRPLPVGQPWTPPGEERPGRARELVDLPRWLALVGTAAAEGGREEDTGPGPRSGLAAARSVLLRRVAYLSGINAGHVLDGVGPAECFRRWRALVEMAEAKPHLVHLPSGPQPYPCPLSTVRCEPLASLLHGMQTLREAGGPGPDADRGQVARRLAAESRRLSRKLANLRRQLKKAGRASGVREEAALILSSLHLIEDGASKAILTGFDGEERSVVLDPRLRPQDHANALFRRAARLERAAAELPGRISAADEALSRIAGLRARHDSGDLSAGEAASLLPPPRTSRPRPYRRREGSATLPYRVFTSTGGIRIRVGRGARHNDALTFHHSRPTDIWLHARHAAGAHVILRWAHPEHPPATDLQEAAILAATHSGARGSGLVPVDWTRRKWVRKPRGSPPGAVIPDRVKTLFVAPDATLAKRLIAP